MGQRGARLAAKEYDLAVENFEAAYEVSETEIDKLMHASWIALTRLLETPSDQSKEAFDTAYNNLNSSDHEYAKFFAEQLTTAHEIFSAADENN